MNFKIHPQDTVAVALSPSDGIPMGHKVALCDIKKGEKVMKYGFPIGVAKEDIPQGTHVHTHNVSSDLKRQESYDYTPDFRELPRRPAQTFMGYQRPDGKVGIRNEIWIIPTVGCVNAIAKEIAKGCQADLPENVDGVFAYCHPYGCSQLGDDMRNTQKLLSGLIHHPNAGGVLVLSLGCENNTLEEMQRILGPVDPNRVKFLVCQDTEDEVAEGKRLVKELLSFAGTTSRTPCDVSELCIGLKCGGSDGLSGITANPLVGQVSDLLISMGASAILTEVPEMFGAEALLFSRCRNREVFEKAVHLINDFKDYFTSYGEPIDENPSPGNKAGGITTLAEKALGCTQKGGTAPVEDVLDYGETVQKKGLSLLQSPGNDLIAACALAAAGAHMVLFTTGRGTPFACPVPTVKIATNTALAHKKPQWIDFNAGVLVEGEAFGPCAEALLSEILQIAQGKNTKSEALDKSDLAIFKDGVTL